MEDSNHFHVADYIVFAATLVASLSIGLFFAFRKQKAYSSKDYFFGGGMMNAVPVALSFVVTFQSSLMIIGDSAESYAYGILFGMRVPGILLAYCLGAIITVPIFRPMKITSIYKYFNLRYGSNEVRFVAAVAGSMYLLFYMAIITVGTSVALNSVMGLPYWVTIVVYTVITTIYTSLGGFKAVIWTDVFQLVVMVTGILATLIKSSSEAGGLSAVYELSNGRLDIAEFRVDPTIRFTLWSVIFGSITQFMIIFFSQMGLQRINSTPNIKTAYIMVGITTPVYCLFIFLVCFEGVAIFAYYSSTGCEPLASGRISNINEIVPTAVLDLFGHMPGFPGLFIASLSSAALSSLSSCLTALSSITFEDIIKVRYHSISDQNATKLSKVVVFIYGGLSLGTAFLLTLASGGVTAIFQSFMGSIDGPTCGIFIVSIFFLRSTPKGVITGALTGMLVSMTLNLGQTFLSAASSEYLPLGPTDRCPSMNASSDLLLINSSGSPYYMFTGSSKGWHYGDVVPAFTTTGAAAVTLSTSRDINHTFVTPGVDTENEANALKKIFGISYMLYSLTGFLVTVVIGVVVSLLTKPTPKEKIDLASVYPLPNKFCSLFPEGFFCSKKQRQAVEKEDGVSDELMEDVNEALKDVFEKNEPL